jgi:cell cycle arrest protein BUB2
MLNSISSVDEHRPMKLLRIFPPLQANSIIGITLALAKDLPDELYKELVKHPVSG